MADWAPTIAVIAGAVVTYAWRALGVALGGRVAADGPVVRWFGCVTYALIAGLVARMILLPLGPLAAVSLSSRLLAAALAMAAFWLGGRNLLLGVVVGGAALAGFAAIG